MNELWSELIEQVVRHRGKVVGTLLGLLFGWMVVEYGIGKTLFVALCLAAGFLIGSRVDGAGGGSGRRPW